MVYVKWTCSKCGDILISNSNRRHEMDTCRCGESSLDLEEEYARMIGSYKPLEKLDYNFFDEIVICMVEQGFNPLIRLEETRVYLSLTTVYKIRKIEDKIIKEMLK